MTTYSISLDDVDLALLPLRTHSYNNFLKKDIYQFQVMKTVSSEAPEPPIFYTCHICAIEVPAAFASEHAASQKHQANVRIASVAAERMRAFISTLPPTHATKPCARFCVNCSKEAGEDHEKTNEHRAAVMLDSLLWDLMKAYVQDHDESKCNSEIHVKQTNVSNNSKINDHKQDEVNTNQIKGNDKNNNDLDDNNSQPMELIEEIVEQEGKLVEKICELNDNSGNSSEDNMIVNVIENIDMNNKIEEKTSKEHILIHEKDDYGEELRKFINDKSSFEYKELVKISIKLNDYIINNIDSDHYHSYDRTCDDGSLNCIVCDCVLNDKDAEAHKYDLEHVRRVANLGNDGHYIREINEFYSHCILCNLKIQNIDLESHKQSATHNVKEYLYTNTRSGIIKEHREAVCNVKLEELSDNDNNEELGLNEAYSEHYSLEEYFIFSFDDNSEEYSENEETDDSLEKYCENNELKMLFEEHSEDEELEHNPEEHIENEKPSNKLEAPCENSNDYLEQYCKHEESNACLVEYNTKEPVGNFKENSENEKPEDNTEEYSENEEIDEEGNCRDNEEPIHNMEKNCENEGLNNYNPNKRNIEEEPDDNSKDCSDNEEFDYNSKEYSENEESEDNWKDLSDNLDKLTDDITNNIMVKIEQLTTEPKEYKIGIKREEIKKNIVKYDSQKYAEELRKYIDDKDSFEFKETYIMAQIKIKDSILKTYSDHFHGYNRLSDKGTIKCMVCDSVFDEEHGDDHKFDSKHMRKIANLGEDGHYIREINETHSHCILCNLKIENINVATHKELFSHKFGKRLFTRSATTNVIEDVIARDGTEIQHSPSVINQSFKDCESNCHTENHDADQELKVENDEINQVNTSTTSTDELNSIQSTKDQNVLVTNNDVETVAAKVAIENCTSPYDLIKAVNNFETNNHHDIKDYGNELRQFIDSKCNFEFNERSNVIRIMMNDEIISIYSDHFHSFDRTYYGRRLNCIVCDCILEFEEAEQHKYDPKHMRRVVNLGNDQHYLRKIDESHSHCILCNLKIKNENLDKHKRVLLHTIKKDLYTSKTENTKKEVEIEKPDSEIQDGDRVSKEKNITNAVGPIKTIDTIVGIKIEHPYEVTATGTLRCMVCDCQVPNGVQNREEHVRGLRHRNLIWHRYA
ncbi:protein PF3D7_1417600-like [Cydia splendana]|uniref:protein PF3D7_1417600-like n=1 Tax=Cydia splendana TaxID=1100963 RepID=UPI00300D1436